MTHHITIEVQLACSCLSRIVLNDICTNCLSMQLLFVFSDQLVVSTSCSLMHTAVDLINETKLDNEIKSWLAFAAQKVVEVNALAKALAGQKDEVHCFLLLKSKFTTISSRDITLLHHSYSYYQLVADLFIIISFAGFLLSKCRCSGLQKVFS